MIFLGHQNHLSFFMWKKTFLQCSWKAVVYQKENVDTIQHHLPQAELF